MIERHILPRHIAPPGWLSEIRRGGHREVPLFRTSFTSVFRPELFRSQNILVTGGGTGIGRCIAHELASLGAHVVIAGRRTEPLDQVVAEIREAGGDAEAVLLNIRDEEQVDGVMGGLFQRLGHLHGVVNNAGGQFASPAAVIKPKGWRAVVDTNLNGTWFVSQAAFRHGMGEKGGAIVNIVADMWNGFPGMAHTGAARAGVVNLTQTLAVEWGPSGVRVNAVAPGFILSSGMKNYPEPVLALAKETIPINPSGRGGTESEVSAAVAFLLCPAAAYISGATLRVDGGASLFKMSMLPLSAHDQIAPWNGFHLPPDLPDAMKE